jgi:putative pyruvate formate lyase activating enzyme
MIQNIYSPEDRQWLGECTICPRECRVNRFESRRGVCGMDAGLNIASVCIHRGEEPVISGKKGICNVFFAGCNLRCIFCQNHEISRPGSAVCSNPEEPGSILDKITGILSEGINIVGFVSPSHMVPQMKAIIKGIHRRGFNPVIVYNTNGYDKPATLRSIADLVDVYLPDYKYVTPALSSQFSGASDYPSIALKALKEMYYQKGSSLRTDENGQAEYGMLIRHLVLPGHAEESRKVLRSIAQELSPGVHLSLMSQYHPIEQVKDHPVLHRSLYIDEYESVAEEMHRLGFRNGYVQDMDSFRSYLPDFSREHPFEIT